MSIKIAQAYFENNLSMQANDFDLIDGFYSRTLPENELEIGFDDAEDGECNVLYLEIQGLNSQRLRKSRV